MGSPFPLFFMFIRSVLDVIISYGIKKKHLWYGNKAGSPQTSYISSCSPDDIKAYKPATIKPSPYH